MADNSITARFQDGLVWVTDGIGVTDNISINSIDIGSAILSTGQSYSSVFHSVFVNQHEALINGTTRASISRQGEVLSALETS
ncbi:MAG: hypothetical protein ABJ360_13340 [Roseobacter sp.]